MSKAGSFLREVKVELAKVTWPSKSQTTRYTLIVIAMSIVVALFLGVLDVLFRWILDQFVV
ncbi:MAG: preprotein translocase subunit SecE [Parcubacteria group bacterium]